MEQSLFLEWVQKYFKGITIRVAETLNDTKNPLTYLFKSMLAKNYSVSGKWESINTVNTLVAADVVSVDSTLPLKKRNSLSKASGDICKMGMTLYLNEKQLQDLDTLIKVGGTDAQIVAKLFQDTSKCIGGVYERLESMFLEGLSTGVTLVTDDENVGTGVRVDYGYLNANKFGVSVLWAGNPTTAKPFDDIQRLITKASNDGNNITTVLLDKNTLNAIAATTQAKELFAFNAGFNGTLIPTPSFTQLNTVTSERFGFTFQIVDRIVKTEKNGIQTNQRPWADGSLVFLTSPKVGELVYADLAEKNHAVSGVEYQSVEDYILISKYRKNDPVREFTASQARVIPVINNVDQIYLIDSKTIQA